MSTESLLKDKFKMGHEASKIIRDILEKDNIQESCEHIYGLASYRDVELLKEPTEQETYIDGSQNYIFKYCPKCGKRLVY